MALPARHSVRDDELLVLSDFRLPKDHELIRDLARLRQEIMQTLILPTPNEEVVIYLFGTHEKYQRYLQTRYPNLPPRRAYFVGSPRELAVYTYWGTRIQEDLRHEYTHGLLHASLKRVPLWLDEGLAEYFEIAGTVPGDVNREYAQRLNVAMSNGWRPDLKRLERLEDFSEMKRVDYQEAWAWVHFLLHSSPDTRTALIDYLRELRTTDEPLSISDRLDVDFTGTDVRFVSYLTSIDSVANHFESDPLGTL